LLMRPGYMAAARQLAESCLDDEEQGHVDSLQLGDDPDNDYDWTPESIQRENGYEDTPVLTPGQIVLCLAALHSIYCPGFETVITAPTNGSLFDEEGKATTNYRRGVRWAAIQNGVRNLEDYAERWFTLKLRRFEQILSSAAATSRKGGTPPISH